MPSRSSVDHRGAALVSLGVAALTTCAIYGATLHYGLDYDDYHFLRPHSAAEVLDSFHGSWDRTGVMVPFYRPLTVAFSALRFELFGLNAVAHHVVSLVLFALAAALVGRFVLRATSRTAAAILSVLFFVVHPAMAYSLAAWITNQMHLLQVLVLLAAIAWWDLVRTRRIAWWLPLLGFAVVSFLIKEDGVMLLPALIALHEVRRRTIEPGLRAVPAAFVLLSALAVATLIGVRMLALGELGGYSHPTLSRGWHNVWTTLRGVYRLIPAHREWQQLASAIATFLPLAAVAAWPWISSGSRFCMSAGAAIALVFAPMLVFGTKPEQVYMIGLGFSVVLGGSSLSLFDLAARAPAPPVARLAAGTVVAVALLAFGAVTRSIARDFEPFGRNVLAHDEIVATWGHVAPELRDYVTRKREPGARETVPPNPLEAISVATFNVHGRETSVTGLPYMWMSGRVLEMDVARHARDLTIPLRHDIGAFREPARVRVYADGELATELVLDTSEWRTTTIALRPEAAPVFSRMHRVRITIDHTWRPSEIIKGSEDGRTLGLQIGKTETKD